MASFRVVCPLEFYIHMHFLRLASYASSSRFKPSLPVVQRAQPKALEFTVNTPQALVKIYIFS